MSYHDNHAINDTVLTIINDGKGDQCGMSYQDRCAAADTGILQFRAACRAYSRYRHANYGSRHLTSAEVTEAASFLQNYYREHVKEL
jgi:hypothetical protein